MPVRETAAIRLISTTTGVVTFWALRKMLSLPVSHVVRDDDDACTVYINLAQAAVGVHYPSHLELVSLVPILTTLQSP